MSAANDTQPAVEELPCMLERAIDESCALLVQLQFPPSIDHGGDPSAAQADVPPASPLIDAKAKPVTSTSPILPSQGSSSPADVTSPANDSPASSIEPVTVCSPDNIRACIWHCVSHLFVDANGAIGTNYAAHREVCTMSLTGLKPAEIRAARKTLAEMVPRWKDTSNLIKEIVDELPGMVPPSSSSTVSSPPNLLIPSDGLEDAQLRAAVQSVRDGTQTSKRFLLEVLRFMTIKGLLMWMKMCWYDVHLPAIEENEQA